MTGEPLDLGRIIKVITDLGKLFPARTKKMELAFRYEPKDFPPCHTRPMREGRGFPWQRQVLCHRDHRGQLEIKLIQPTTPPTDPKKRLLK